MLTEDSQVQVLVRGRLAIVESSSEATHWPGREHVMYRSIESRLPWLEPRFFDEASLSSLWERGLQREFCGLVISAGAMAMESVRSQVTANRGRINAALRSGVGVLISGTSLTDCESFDFTFLGEESIASLVPLPRSLPLHGEVRFEGQDRAFEHIDGHHDAVFRTRAGFTADESRGWRPLAFVRGDGDGEGDPEITVAWRARVGLGRAIVTVLPFERLPSGSAFDEALIRITRSMGELVVGAATDPQQHLDTPSGGFAAAVPDLGSAHRRPLTRCFSHLRLARPLMVKEQGLLNKTHLLHRLENDGSVQVPAPVITPELSLVRFAGAPRYLDDARRAATWLNRHVRALAGGPTFQTLAFAVAATVASEVIRDQQLIPSPFRMSDARAVCSEALDSRMADGNVDELLLPTVNLYVAARLVGVTDRHTALDECLEWVRAQHECDDDQLAQASWAAWLLGEDPIRDIVRPAGGEVVSTVAKLGQIVSGRTPTIEDFRALEGLEISPLDHALVDFTREWVCRDETGALVSRERAATATDGGIEEGLYSLAARMLRASREPLASGVQPSGEARINDLPSPESQVPDQQGELVVDLLRARRDARSERSKREELELQLARAQRAGARVVGSLYATWISLSVAGAWLTIGIFDARSVGDLAPVVAALIVLIFGSATLLTTIDRVNHLVPTWVRVMGRMRTK